MYLLIIGEAINHILKKDKNFALENAHKIIGTRNRIAHGYDQFTFITGVGGWHIFH